MNKFKIGDKVKCRYNDIYLNQDTFKFINTGETFVVKGVDKDTGAIYLNIPTSGSVRTHSCSPDHFALVEEVPDNTFIYPGDVVECIRFEPSNNNQHLYLKGKYTVTAIQDNELRLAEMDGSYPSSWFRVLPRKYVEYHPDDVAVDEFAKALKERLSQMRKEENKTGWQTASKDLLNKELIRNSLQETSDSYLDIGNYAMMLWHNVNIENKRKEENRIKRNAILDELTKAIETFKQDGNVNETLPDYLIEALLKLQNEFRLKE